MRRLLLLGMASLALVATVELATDTIAPWDRWLYPVLAGVLAGALGLLHALPHRASWAYLLITLSLCSYLVSAELLALFNGGPGASIMPALTATLWMPLAYTCAFVFLALRTALWVSGLTFAATFVPLGLGLLNGQLAHWGREFPVLCVNMALAHLIYIVAHTAIGQLRLRYLQTREHMLAMAELAATDVLTGLPNRREMMRELDAQLALAQRGGQSLSLLLIDIDDFKQVNDLHGHATGDAVLSRLGHTLGTQLRGSDRLGRWGGEEFVVVVPGVALPGAMELAERLRQATLSGPLPPPLTRLSISLGVAEHRPGDTADTLLQRADAALYRAKQQGRNRVEPQR